MYHDSTNQGEDSGFSANQATDLDTAQATFPRLGLARLFEPLTLGYVPRT